MDRNAKLKILESQIKLNLSEILFTKVNNEKVKYFSITDVRVTKDFLNAKIYVNYFDKAKEEMYFSEFNKIKGFLRSELAKRLTMRKVPELEFILDDLITKIEDLDQLIQKSKK
ncbi:MAG: ribosome-binding factor A [Candidatus Hepatoplasma scabrum]|nr:MAG: ribosome-binding factor A [Candidatus Hepatoplasma sp.]